MSSCKGGMYMSSKHQSPVKEVKKWTMSDRPLKNARHAPRKLR